MANTPICTIDSTGVHKPDFATALKYFQDGFKAIDGADIVIENSSQDGQKIGLIALALDDCNSAAVAAYNSFSPATAQGVGLSSNGKINGIARKLPSHSNADLLLVGQFGTPIDHGIVNDQAGNPWDLPASVTIPISGQITVTATCRVPGAIAAPPNTITRIQTIVPGFQSATNLAASTPGAPVEADSQLRARQAISTELPSQTNLQAITGAIAALPGVTSVIPFENDAFLPDGDSIPGHCIALMVDGGDDTAVATAIQLQKAPGCGTYGTTAIVLLSPQGVPHTYRFFRPAQIPITFNLSIVAMDGYTADIQDRIKQTLSDWTNALGTGQQIFYRRAYMPAQLYGNLLGSDAFELLSLAVARDGGTPVQADVQVLFNERPFCAPAYINITVAV